MNENQAKTMVSDLFSKPFHLERYKYFLKNLLNSFEARDKHYSGNLIPEAFKQYVSQYWRIGKYVDPAGDELDLLVVQVKGFRNLERSRSSLRNFAVSRLKKFGKNASLVAFYAAEDNGCDWRFSFVKIENEAYLDKKDKVKFRQELTPARRYSYLVGEHENSHTACKQLLPILLMDYADPKVRDIESAFSIEKVTDEFFDQYKTLFHKLVEHLEHEPYFLNSSKEEPNVSVSRFSKKLLGQIVFLYFLQKKGWMGVPKNGNWGEGARRFLFDRFEEISKNGGNFYRDFLQYLFYEALASERKEQEDPGYYERFNCRLPFLNGGLFEADYDWHKGIVNLPNNLFHNNEKSKVGDIGTGILDVFERYNFTIKEDEPLDKEVAVDPEMLGKVFENMLEVTERKSKGAFYTPREIVHYMCQESLIHYLDNLLNNYSAPDEPCFDSPQTGLFAGLENGDRKLEITEDQIIVVPREDIKKLIRKGLLALENDQHVMASGLETNTYKYQLPESVRVHARIIDEALADIRVCDPAIGSGAFPVGLLHEIVNARTAIARYCGNTQSAYQLKRHTIAESLYGVDIDPSAIDIARLRLWLSLIVEEDNYENIDALPNLDYKIMQGDSLIGFPDNWQSPASEKIETLKKEFFQETNHDQKVALKKQIDREIRRRMGDSEKAFGWQVDFDFRLFFSEVWHEKGGFDIVIGNPPYIDSEQMTKDNLANTRSIVKRLMRLTQGNWDIYIAFFERGIRLMGKYSFLSYITPDKWLSKPFGKALRQDRLNFFAFITEAGRHVFKEAKVDSVITGISSRKSDFLMVSKFNNGSLSSGKIICKNDLSSPYALDYLFSESLQLITRIFKNKKTLGMLCKCENACATSDAYKLKRYICDGIEAEVSPSKNFKLVNTGTVGKYKFRWGRSKMTYLKDKYLRPYVDRQSFLNDFGDSYCRRAICPKIIIKGLTLLDASLDKQGFFLPGKSTLVIPCENILILKYLLLLINSSIALSRDIQIPALRGHPLSRKCTHSLSTAPA